MHVAIVTGGSSGIGQSAAIQIAKRRAGVILAYNTSQPGALVTVAASASTPVAPGSTRTRI